MKELVSKSSGFTRIEFWVIITIMAFLMFGHITKGLGGFSTVDAAPNKVYFDQANIRFYFYYNYLIPQLVRNVFLFGNILYLNFILIPKLLLRKSLVKNLILLAGVFIVLGLVYSITDTYLKQYLLATATSSDDVYSMMFIDNYFLTIRIFASIALYTVIKYVAIYLIINAPVISSRYKFFKTEGVVGFAVWVIILFLLILFKTSIEVIVGWMSIVLSGIFLYLLSFYRLIPTSLNKKYPFLSYAFKCLVVVVLAFVPFMLLFMSFFRHEDTATAFSFLNSFVQLFIIMPITWTVYKRKMKGNEELIFLKKELNQSSAKIDFLRSQINPHFLFNALNTLYGTALQERAERTGEGIQRLGDMMRFMLQENVQEKISLSREIEYLKNYINLQKLRTDPAPGIDIKTAIQDEENNYQVAPMLLIPFVENAFKHGISFRETSHIRISLSIKEETLYFDVCNSRHPRLQNDPEKDNSGVGLENVKQRLQCLYPDKHELIIRGTEKDFFIHLTIHLN